MGPAPFPRPLDFPLPGAGRAAAALSLADWAARRRLSEALMGFLDRGGMIGQSPQNILEGETVPRDEVDQGRGFSVQVRQQLRHQVRHIYI